MRLLQTTGVSFKLKEFPADRPSYAILSHTWGENGTEVTFADFKHGSGCDEAGREKTGYNKLAFCSQRAKHNGLQYFWVDTCCIDKSNQAELTESIASMFRWYEEAARCYVYLSDVSFDEDGDAENRHLWEPALRASKWFRRGWTLQELLAPKSVEFFSAQGRRLGDKQSLETQIHQVTGISIRALRGDPLHQFPVEERMRWTEGRRTTRAEDRAYCLLGIFGVFLSPIYGEGDNAFKRLNREIRQDQDGKSSLRIRWPYTYELTRARLGDVEQPAPKRRKTASQVLDLEYPGHDNSLDVGQHHYSVSREALIDGLRFDQINDRFDNIKPGLARTCKWLLQSPPYLDWLNPEKLDEHHGFFWIRGKPGSGKSTLTKFAFLELRQSLGATKIVSFFFNARGTQLEKSTMGLYRSLLVQLLEICPQDQVFALSGLTQPSVDQISKNQESLKQIFSEAIHKLGQQDLTIVIDALDECDEDEAFDMVNFFEGISDMAVSEKRTIRILLASRHYPQITIKQCANMILENQLGHSEDIEKYLESELKVAGQLGDEIRADVQDRASGIFIWTVLVVQILNKSFARGQVHTLRKKLQELPEDLNELFRDLLMRDTEDLDTMKLCLQWILYARRPMTPEELYYAVLSGMDQSGLEPGSFFWNQNIVSKDTIDRFIINNSKGLAETTKSRNRNVQFIHESVRDFLLKKNGLGELWPDLQDNPSGLSHEKLKDCCSVYINSDRLEQFYIPDPLPVAKSSTAQMLRSDIWDGFPFLEYALWHIFAHADEAHAAGVDQETFLEQNGHDLKKWVRFNNVIERHQIRRHHVGVDLKYISAERNYPNLMEIILRHNTKLVTSTGRFGSYVFTAIANDHHEVFETLVRYDAQMHPHGCPFPYPAGKTLLFLLKHAKPAFVQKFLSTYVLDHAIGPADLHKIFGQALRKRETSIIKVLLEQGADINEPVPKMGTPLLYASSRCDEEIVKLMLDHCAYIDVQARGSYERSLNKAALMGDEGTATVELLLGRSADLTPQLGELHTRIFRAVMEGTAYIQAPLRTIELLLDRGADVNVRFGNTPGCALVAAILGIRNPREKKHRLATVKLLLDRGADINMQSGWQYHDTALTSAVHLGEEDVDLVKLLLDRGAHVNGKTDDVYSSVLIAAATQVNRLDTVKLLLESGADINAQPGGQYGSALIAAAAGGEESKSTVELLLEKGADINAQPGGKYGSALIAAAARGKESKSTVELLLEKGADVNAQPGDQYGSALIAAAAGGEESKSTVELLLEKGADINAQPGGKYGSALIAAAAQSRENKYIVKLLLEKGADINAQPGGQYGSALIAAAAESCASVGVIELLLEKGADVNAHVGGRYGSALMAAAARWSRIDFVKLLLEKGADVNAPGNDSHSCALEAARATGNREIEGLLLQRGAS